MNQQDRSHHTVGRLPILIDGFKFHKAGIKVSAYFLSHFHSDHYGGLDEQFPWTDEGALLYCSEVTAALAVNVLGVHPKHVRAKRFGERFSVGLGLTGVSVTLIPANHCPGAAMLLFELPDGQRILHCGDMRFDPSMTRYPSLVSAVSQSGGLADVLLDTTYAHQKHVFAGQSESVDEILAAVRLYLQEGANEAGLPSPPGAATAGGDPTAAGPGGQPPAKRQRKARAGALSAAGVGLHKRTTAPVETDNSKFALSASDIGMRDGAQAWPAQDMGGGQDVPAVQHTATAEGGGQYQWVNDGPWGRGWQALYPGSAPIPTQAPTHVHGMGMSRRFAHLPTPEAGMVADSEDTLFLVCTYATGKERILVGIIRSLHMRVYMSSRKLRMAELIGLPAADIVWLTEEKTEASVHVVGMQACGRNFPYFQPNWQGLLRYMEACNVRHGCESSRGAHRGPQGLPGSSSTGGSAGAGDIDDSDEADLLAAAAAQPIPTVDVDSAASATGTVSVPASMIPSPQAQSASTTGTGRYKRIVGIVPTGWVHSSKKRVYSSPCGRAAVHLVPYSEHSSYEELCAFLSFLRPARITPTVYADGKDGDRIKALFAVYVNQTAAKKAFFSGFGKASAPGLRATAAVAGSTGQGRDTSGHGQVSHEADIVDVEDASSDTPPFLPPPGAAMPPSAPVQPEVDIVEVVGSEPGQSEHAAGSSWKCHACLHSWGGSAQLATAPVLVHCTKCGSDFVELTKHVESSSKAGATKIDSYFSSGRKS